MSSRFHSKFHRHNHHTTPSNDPRYPDSAHDPIASPDYPFQGDFVIQGMLSASGGMSSQMPLTGTVVFDPSVYQSSFSNPITATGDYLKVNISGIQRAVRLWSYE